MPTLSAVPSSLSISARNAPEHAYYLRSDHFRVADFTGPMRRSRYTHHIAR
jgi:hypothetical protein